MHNPLATTQTVNPETGTIYTRQELADAFQAVQDQENWKRPIRAYIPADMRDVTEEAVIFFAGCRPTFHTCGPRKLRVEAVGYYLAVGA